MAKYNVRQGESLAVEIPVFNPDGTAKLVDTGLITNVIVTLSNKGVIFQKYSLTDMGVDFGDLTTLGSIISLVATRGQTKLWEVGFANATITIEETDVALGLKVYDFEVTGLIAIYPSANKEINLI